MIIPLEPRLNGLAERRFFCFARQVLDRQHAGDSRQIAALVETEATRAPQLRDLKGQSDEYKACIRVLGDLAHLRWKLVESKFGLELHSPRPDDDHTSGTLATRMHKQAIRDELRPRLIQQFSDEHVQRFIRRMERPLASAKHDSVRKLIADGAELQERLSNARRRQAHDPERANSLREAVRPYLQLVDPKRRDKHTRIPLGHVWRYFRYTWSIPQTPIPGRSLLYLVRDAAHATHAVIGIAALSNCPVQLVPRDRAIGWSASALAEALAALFEPPKERRAHETHEPVLRFHGVYQWLKPALPADGEPTHADKRAALQRMLDWLLQGITDAIADIEYRGLATDEQIAAPTPRVVEHLRQLSREFAAQRQHSLADPDGKYRASTFGDALAAEAPVADSVLNLEPKHSSNIRINNSRRMLIRKKRASELARLLDARRTLDAKREILTSPDTVFNALDADETRIAVNTAITAIKSRRIGTNLLEITTCGAVAPYNHILGGKLVALLLLSPQVAADNLHRYGNEPTIIRSQLKNRPFVPDNTLVWLGTTSLYARGSSQYERLRLPAGTISPDQPELRYTRFGATSGYGTVQFANDTVRALDIVLQRKRGYRDVNSVFGEGASPRLRKLRSGLDAIGFNAGLAMLHHQERLIYGVPLFPGAGRYLCGLPTDLPDYISSPDSSTDATERIAEFWRRRWLSRRLAHADSWSRLGNTRAWLLSDTIPMPAPPPASPADPVVPGGGGGSDESGLEFWRRLARAESNVISEGLTDEEFDILHLHTPLEDHLLDQARDGYSIVLTGNAGDGKTHLARVLQKRLGTAADDFAFAFDATAIMNSEDGVAPIIDLWRQAVNAGRPFVLAINQYPLYMLRRHLHASLPEVSCAIERQWRTRLVAKSHAGNSDEEKLLLVDLSLRNPLSPRFAQRALARMLVHPAVRRHADLGSDSNFSFNFERLSHPDVRRRLLDLFDRIVSSGRRTTVRELWILIARLLFGKCAGEEPPGVAQSWYSERLLDLDPRFPLSEFLCTVADPATVSHPHVDRYLEDHHGVEWVDGWLMNADNPEPLRSPISAIAPSNADRREYRKRFLALKRRFYFEHSKGGAGVFRLDHRSHSGFHAMLRTPEADIENRRALIAFINRCYFPHQFEGIDDKLYLWIGHRLDEQPTKSFVAKECIPSDRLHISRPRPPDPLDTALDYLPDHLVLSADAPSSGTIPTASLRIDAALFRTLSAISAGLPRHLINPGELNRLDTFLDQLRHLSPSPVSEFITYNAEHVASNAVKLSPGLDRYLSVRSLL